MPVKWVDKNASVFLVIAKDWSKTNDEYVSLSLKANQQKKAVLAGVDTKDPKSVQKFVAASEKLAPTVARLAQLQKKLAHSSNALVKAQKELKKAASSG